MITALDARRLSDSGLPQDVWSSITEAAIRGDHYCIVEFVDWRVDEYTKELNSLGYSVSYHNSDGTLTELEVSW